jgi:transcriptional regulator with AAA-type ATPase domain
MAKESLLTTDERELFRMVHEVIFSNPFSGERQELTRQIAGVSKKVPSEDFLTLAHGKVQERVAQLEAKQKADLRLYPKKDRRLVQSALLYETYRRFVDDFDLLIQKQIKSGDTPCTVPFAKDAFSLFSLRGFTAEESRRFFALFYQLRRAFYFIHHSLSGQTPSMRELRCHLWGNIFTFNPHWYVDFLWNRMEDFSTLLLGETGSGKGAAAAAIGRSGFIPFDEKKGCFAESFTRNFIELNLSQFPETLIESEMFGHKKGAFTGAIADHQGAFARCTPHGAIFLDEIGDVATTVQVKLLHVLQERTFTPVGGSQKQRFRGRVIAATNKSLEELRQKGTFRDDFFYRLCSDIVTVPPLRQRLHEDPQELEVLLEHVVKRILGEASSSLVKTIRDILDRELGRDYQWPGNVRELEQAVRRILLNGRYLGETQSRAFDLRSRLHQEIDFGSLDAQELLASYCALLYKSHGSYEEVARRTRLDRRTVKKHIQMIGEGFDRDDP